MTVRRPRAVPRIGSKRPDITKPELACAAALGLTAPWVLDGPMTRAAFNLMSRPSLPTLDKGDVCRSG